MENKAVVRLHARFASVDSLQSCICASTAHIYWYALFFDQALSPACDCIETVHVWRSAKLGPQLKLQQNCTRPSEKTFSEKCLQSRMLSALGACVRHAENSSKTNYPHVERICGVTNSQTRTKASDWNTLCKFYFVQISIADTSL
jgi:hypothetical protein